MKETVIGRITELNGERVIIPLSNIDHAERMLDYQTAKRDFMEAAAQFMADPTTEFYSELVRRYKLLTNRET